VETVYLPFVASALFGIMAPRLARALPPALATWLMSVGALLSAAATSAALGLLALPLVAQLPALSSAGRWSDSVLRRQEGLAPPVSLLALVLVVVLGAAGLRVLAQRGAALRSAFRLARALPWPGELAVVDDGARAAFAVPAWPGRIVVTSGMLRELDAGERRALLAHERSHLRHRHHLHQAATALAAAANPLLWRLPAAVRLSCERWADEDAAATCHRETAAAALVRAALGRSPCPPGVLAAAATDVAVRIAALRSPAPRAPRWRVLALVAVVVAAVAAALEAAHDTEQIFELAQAAYRSAAR
jgi:Zn-dependent protease with chaperone function